MPTTHPATLPSYGASASRKPVPRRHTINTFGRWMDCPRFRLSQFRLAQGAAREHTDDGSK